MNDDVDDVAPVRATQRDKPAVTWYDPEGWPSWLRWCLALPISLLAAIVVFFIYNIANSFFPDMPAAVTRLLAILIGSSAFVVCGRYVAPAFGRYVGYSLGVALLVFAGYVMGNVMTQGSGSLPKWYAVLMPIAAAVGAVYACFADVPESGDPNGREIYSWMPGPLRWLTFIPFAFVLTIVVCFALGLPLAFLRLNFDIIKLVNTPITAAVFIGVAAAVAPSHKKAVAITLGAFIALFAIGLFLSALDRPLTIQVISRITHADPSTLGFYMSPWYQILSSSGALAGVLIAILATARVAKAPRAKP